MDKCPNEILGLIFAEACTDDGLTGRSLSLVSRRIHNASRRYALQSVALYGSYQLSAFVRLLDKADLEDRHICHLYLTDRRRAWMEYPPGQDRERWLRERIAADIRRFNDSRLRHSSSAILRILKTVAPTVQTLTLLLFDQYDEQPLSDAVPFPKLRELTIHISNMTYAVQSELPQCMSLRRLHVIQDFLLKRPIATAVSQLSPLLTHLRISRLASNPLMDVVPGLEDMLHQDDLASTGFPPTLKRVLVQMLQQRLYGHNGHGALRQMLNSPIAYQLRDVAMQDVQQRIVFLKPAIWNLAETLTGENSDVHFYMGIKAAWEKRMVESESAFWDVEPSSILASYGYCAEGE
ncbi:hypothetical protein LXA43DRAFT_1048439 [Ganoderma leucocontextum]|nr:hypothetical protein LXA43DRAFT_1048439 [Ganoderma leucocontextum]